jgi:hypothetical protein
LGFRVRPRAGLRNRVRVRARAGARARARARRDDLTWYVRAGTLGSG